MANLFNYFTELDRRRELAKRGGTMPTTMARPMLSAPPPAKIAEDSAPDPFARPIDAPVERRISLGTPPVPAPAETRIRLTAPPIARQISGAEIDPFAQPVETVSPERPKLILPTSQTLDTGAVDFRRGLVGSEVPVRNAAPVDRIDLGTPRPARTETPIIADRIQLRPSQRTAQSIEEVRNKQYGSQKDENGNIRRDENGKPLYEADRDSDHNWWDVVKSAGLGFARGGIGGAIGGAISGAVDRNFDEKTIDNVRLENLNRQFANQSQIEQMQQGYDAKQAQIENIKHDNDTADRRIAIQQKTSERNSLLSQVRTMKRYKRGENPAFDEKLESANIEQPDFEPGKKLKPRFYDGDGRMLTFDENNATVPVKNERGEDIVDESRANIYVNGYAVKGRDALNATVAAGNTNTRFGNEDDADKIKYDSDVREVNAYNKGVDAEIQSKREVAKNLELANQELEAKKAPLMSNPLLNSEQIKAIDLQIGNNTNAWRTANGEITALGGKRKPLPVAPKPRTQVSTPTVSSVGSYSEAQFRRNFEGSKTPEQIETLVKAAKQQGIIK